MTDNKGFNCEKFRNSDNKFLNIQKKFDNQRISIKRIKDTNLQKYMSVDLTNYKNGRNNKLEDLEESVRIIKIHKFIHYFVITI